MSQFAKDFPVGSKVTRNNIKYCASFIEEGVTYTVLGKGKSGTYLGGECIDLAHLDGTKVSPHPDGFACKAFDLVDGGNINQNAFIKTHTPQQVRAVVDEAQRLGYTPRYPVNYKEVVSVVFRSDGTYQLKRYHTEISDHHFFDLGYREIKQTRHIRRDLCGKTYSQDGQAVLDVVEKSYVPETIDVQPLKWVKPTAYNPIVNWVAEKLISAYAVVRKVAVALINHIK